MELEIEKSLPIIPKFLGVGENTQLGMLLLYLVVFILCAAVFKLGFAKKLPVLKTIVVYLILALFCTFLSFLATILPIAEGLLIILVVLLIYKFRFKREYSQEQ